MTGAENPPQKSWTRCRFGARLSDVRVRAGGTGRDPPRELIGSLPGVTLTEMPRHGNRSFCCGAGGARMWMEEKLGTRINGNRMDEALATGAEQVAVACPFCRVMLGDSLTAKQAEGTAGDSVEVVDVAQMLLAAVRRADPQPQQVQQTGV